MIIGWFIMLWRCKKNNNQDAPATTEGMVQYEVPFAGYCNTVGPDQGVFYSSAFWTQYLLPWLKNWTMFFMSPRDMIGIKKEMTLLADDK